MTRYLCIHGHFYQPPREDAWTGAIPNEPSAVPFANWNERIAAECYAPNAQAAILDAEGEVAERVNNYSSISFNVGPTLLDWLERRQPSVVAALRQADQASMRRLGEGNAIAQAYHHAILPLASERDRVTEVAWGIAAFARTFGRRPKGMWLPEAAVDTLTLEVLADAGIAFTLLAPRQARAIRAPDGVWRGVEGGVPTHRPYRVALPSGRAITVFFYDGPLSQAVAFERVLDNGETFAARMLDAARRRPEGALLHLATDGESYGHHHRFGEMALAYALRTVDAATDVQITNYAAYLNTHPATCEARIVEPSSWSCAHGVERWRSNCGCAADAGPGPRHAWRAPLRRALDRLRDVAAHAFEHTLAPWVDDPWALRDAWGAARYLPPQQQLDVLSDAVRGRGDGDATLRQIVEALETQRHALAMYASCGWFFDEPGGIEPLNNLRHAMVVLARLPVEVAAPARERFLDALSGFGECRGGTTASLVAKTNKAAAPSSAAASSDVQAVGRSA